MHTLGLVIWASLERVMYRYVSWRFQTGAAEQLLAWEALRVGGDERVRLGKDIQVKAQGPKCARQIEEINKASLSSFSSYVK